MSISWGRAQPVRTNKERYIFFVKDYFLNVLPAHSFSAIASPRELTYILAIP
jgi:hypothetical protein